MMKKSLSKHEFEIYDKDLLHLERNLPNLAIAAVSGYENEVYQADFFNRFIESFINLYWWIEDFSGFNINLLTSDTPAIIYSLNIGQIVSSPRITDLLENIVFPVQFVSVWCQAPKVITHVRIWFVS